MLGFAKAPKDPLSDTRSAQRWIESFTASDPLAAHAALIVELGRIAQPAIDRRPAALEALFFVDAQAREMRERLFAQYIAHAPRSDKIEEQLWHALFDLSQGFLRAYAACERDVLEHAQEPAWQALLPELLMRQILQLGVDAQIRMFRYEAWIPAKWADLHRCYTLASARKLEGQRLTLAGEPAPRTIEQKYLATLVLHLCNAGNLDRAQLDWLAHHLDDWCAPLALATESTGPTAFYLNFEERHGLRRRDATPLEGPVMFLDTEPLHALLQHYILAVEQKVRGQPLAAKTPRRIEHLGLLTKLAMQVDPAFRPMPRRGERTAAVGAVDAIVGLQRITDFLHNETDSSVPELDTVGTYSGTLDIAVFGHLRDEDARRKAVARRRLAAFTTPGGPWEIKDVSATGLRLIAPMTAAGSLTLGTLVALRAEGDVVWKLGIVRRMRRVTADAAEVGLQRIADSITQVDLCTQRPEHDHDYDVEGNAMVHHGRSFRGLFLALQPREGRKVIQSLIFPASEYRSGGRHRLQGVSASYPVRFAPVIETQKEWCWTGVETGPSTEIEAPSPPLSAGIA
ncbi:MAG: hypothetical protein ABIS17_02680 [Casimicrobiaceae bacterium]